MRHRLGVTLAALAALAAAAAAAEMGAEVRVDREHPRALTTRFSTYGFQPRRSVVVEPEGFRLWLPGSDKPAAQTGVYSLFALAGDCEAALTYELLDLPVPEGGYGSSVGLALDGPDGGWRGDIQRIVRPGKESGYLLHTGQGTDEDKNQSRFVPGRAEKGRLGLRREGSELVFLTADSPDGELREIDRLPFTGETLRQVRVFADPGGSPTAVDVRVSRLTVRAEEITSGVAKRDKREAGWWWLGLLVPVAGLVVWWRWRVRRRRDEDEDDA